MDNGLNLNLHFVLQDSCSIYGMLSLSLYNNINLYKFWRGGLLFMMQLNPHDALNSRDLYPDLGEITWVR